MVVAKLKLHSSKNPFTPSLEECLLPFLAKLKFLVAVFSLKNQCISEIQSETSPLHCPQIKHKLKYQGGVELL